MDTAALQAAGFTRDEGASHAYADFASKNGLHSGGQYVVLGVWRRGGTTLLFEQNTTTEPSNGLEITISHPPVCIVTTPSGRVACNAADIDLILLLAGE